MVTHCRIPIHFCTAEFLSLFKATTKRISNNNNYTLALPKLQTLKESAVTCKIKVPPVACKGGCCDDQSAEAVGKTKGPRPSYSITIGHPSETINNHHVANEQPGRTTRRCCIAISMVACRRIGYGDSHCFQIRGEMLRTFFLREWPWRSVPKTRIRNLSISVFFLWRYDFLGLTAAYRCNC